MASNIPLRRTTRATRTTVGKDNENANARPSRMATRSKAALATTATAPEANRATAPTAASKAKASDSKAAPAPATKRKREALVELARPAPNAKSKGKIVGTTKGKGKEKEEPKVETVERVAPKPEATVKKTTTTRARKSLPSVTVLLNKRTTRSTTTTHVKVQEVKDEVPEPSYHGEQDAVVDENRAPSGIPPPRVFTRRTTASISRTLEVLEEASNDIVEDTDPGPAFKKRHTEEDLLDKSQMEADVVAAELAPEDEMPDLQRETVDPAEMEEHDHLWDDIDAEDIDDPLMVSEYVGDVFQYLLEVEQTTLPNPDYMESQKELDWQTRATLVDWLIQVHAHCRMLPETLFLCTNIIDRFLSARSVSLSKLQLVGVTCFFIAAKFEETFSPSVTVLSAFADSVYTEAEILKAERFVLRTIDWNLSYPNAINFLRRVSKADDSEHKARTVGKYLMEIGCLEWRLVATPPSLLAAAALWLARLILGREDWTPNLIHYSSYHESELLPVANVMLNYVLKPIQHEWFHKKYASKRFLKASLYVRQWALHRWDEGSRVSLVEDLPALKAEVRLEREREMADPDADVFTP